MSVLSTAINYTDSTWEADADKGMSPAEKKDLLDSPTIKKIANQGAAVLGQQGDDDYTPCIINELSTQKKSPSVFSEIKKNDERISKYGEPLKKDEYAIDADYYRSLNERTVPIPDKYLR